MELGFKLFTYVILANLLYMVLTLIKQGFRHYSGYIGQLTVFIYLIIMMMSKGYGSGAILLTAIIGTFILVILPIILQRHIDILMAEGLFKHLRTYTRIKASLAWSNINAHLRDIGEYAHRYAGNADQLEIEMHKLLGQGKPYDNITKIFLGYLHFNNRNYVGLIKDLRDGEIPLPKHSFDELMYLVRGYLETTDYEAAILSQLALEGKASKLRLDVSVDKYNSLIVSRMICFAFLGWIEEFKELIEARHQGILALPPSLTDFWEGVCLFNNGEYDGGEAMMYSVIKSSAELDEHDPWLPFMRNRLRGLIDNKEFYNDKVLPHLKALQEKYSPIIKQVIIAQIAKSRQIKTKRKVSNLLVFVTCVISGAFIYQYNIEDVVELIKIGSNSSFLVKQGEYFRLFTHQFVHIGFLHLFMNMFAIRIFGPLLETLIGASAFIFLYIFSGISGGALAVYQGQQLSAGASGAVFGLLAASLVFEVFSVKDIKTMDKRTSKSTLLFILGINIIIGLIEHNIDNWAHLGGFLGGGLIAIILLPGFKSKIYKGILAFIFSISLISVSGYATYQGITHETKISNAYLAEEVKTFAGPNNLFSLSIPSSWKIPSKENQDFTRATGSLGEQVIITSQDLSESLEAHIAADMNSFKKQLETTEGLQFNARQGPDPITVNGLTGYVIYWDLANNEAPLSINEYYLKYGNKSVYINFATRTSHRSSYSSLFTKILGSIKIENEL